MVLKREFLVKFNIGIRKRMRKELEPHPKWLQTLKNLKGEYYFNSLIDNIFCLPKIVLLNLFLAVFSDFAQTNSRPLMLGKSFIFSKLMKYSFCPFLHPFTILFSNPTTFYISLTTTS